jgi:hypothetical protein
MGDLVQFLKQLVPVLGILLVALAVVVLLSALGPALLIVAVLALLGLAAWIYFCRSTRP